MEVGDTGLVFLRLTPWILVFSDVNVRILPVLQYWRQSSSVGIN